MNLAALCLAVEATCFQANGDVGAEIFTTFSSLPIVAKQVGVTLEALLNPTTGRRYSGATSGGAPTPTADVGSLGSAAATTCAACFSCKVPEARFIWLIVAMTVGCVKDEAKFAGRMEQHCLDNGTWYVEEACGPRTGVSLLMSDPQWRQAYPAHRAFDAGRTQAFAGKFEQLARDTGGASNAYPAQRIADAWFNRNVDLGEDQAGNFYRAVCKQMRVESEYTDIGPGFSNYTKGSMPHLVGDFLYSSYANSF